MTDVTLNETSSIDDEGREHTFRWEEGEFRSLDQWLIDNKSAEDVAFWMENDQVGSFSDRGSDMYAEWLVATKMVHTVKRPNGEIFSADYRDYI
jgi:hypothetical protein